MVIFVFSDFFLELAIDRLFLFAISPLVRYVTMQKIYFGASLSCHLSACSVVFVYV